MLLSIITVNRNGSAGLRRTMESVISQSFANYEHVVIDGASSDDSVDVIKSLELQYHGNLKWISEPDGGIYNAMNKGLALAKGDYVQFLNSGDFLAGQSVVENIYASLKVNDFPQMMYGNMIKAMPDGRHILDKSFAGEKVTMLGMYSGTLNHSATIIRRSLFDALGVYDESMRICSDWKWFLDAVVFEGVKPVYCGIDISVFDMSGISENRSMKDLLAKERMQTLTQALPAAVLDDYEVYSPLLFKIRRISRYKFVFRLTCFFERCLFKYEKIKGIRTGVQKWG